MAVKNDLQHSLHQILKHNRDGSHSTQANRRYMLNQIVREINQGGYKIRHVQALKRKHVQHLNDQWKIKGLENSTIKNRNATLRWLCAKLNKRDLMPSNDGLGIGKRKYVSEKSKAFELSQNQLNKITDHRVLVQLQLQQHFGLRREEAIKFQPYWSDQGDSIRLGSSWCKGGKARIVPIISDDARYWLEEAKKLVTNKKGSLAGDKKQYKTAQSLYDKQVQRAGIKNPHGLRHAYAQKRYQKLTGWASPYAGGPSKQSLTAEQRVIDSQARLQISQELGHGREGILVSYCYR